MTDPFRPAWFGVALLIVALVDPAKLPAQEARPQGVWHLDAVRSDSLRAPVRQSMDSVGPDMARPDGSGPGGMPPGAGGTPEMDAGRRYQGARYRRAMTEKELGRIRQTLALARRAPARIHFEEDGHRVKLTDAQGFETTLRIDGKSVRDIVVDGGDVYTKARWDEETLIIERRVDGGGRVIERYTLGLGGIRLLSFVAVEALLQPLEFTRQFER